MTQFRHFVMCILVGFGTLDMNAQTVFDELQDVNRYWSVLGADVPHLNQEVIFNSDEERIQTHLRLVIAELKKHTPKNISAQAIQQRQELLSKLAVYAEEAHFPMNTGHAARTPYFIDHWDVACAVGYMIIQSGHSELARQIQLEHNNGYLMDLAVIYPQIEIWADDHGFTLQELAWIQPGYSFQPDYCHEQRISGFHIEVRDVNIDSIQYVWYHVDSNRVYHNQYLPLACSGNRYWGFALLKNGDTVPPRKTSLVLGSMITYGVGGNLLELPKVVPIKVRKTITPDDGRCNGNYEVKLLQGSERTYYNWHNMTMVVVVKGQNKNLCAGLYPVVVTDSAGCQIIDTVIIPRVYLTSDPEPQIDNPEKGSLVIRLDREKWSNSELRFTDANGISVENLKFSGEKDSIVLARPQSGVLSRNSKYGAIVYA